MARTIADLHVFAARVHAAERALEAARRDRDEVIRDLRRGTSHTVPELADAADVSPATVKAVLRGTRAPDR